MAAGGFREFIAGEVLDEDKINDFLMQGILVFANAAARGSAIPAPVEGQFAFLKDSDTLTFHDGTSFVEFSTEPGAAVVSSTTGSPTINSGTVISGITYDLYTFNGSGSIIFSDPGFVDVLLVGGGGAGGTFYGGGGGGAGFFETLDFFASGTAVVTVGAGGAGGTAVATEGRVGDNGFTSRFASMFVAGGGGGGAATVSNNTTDQRSGRGLSGGSGGGASGFSTGSTGAAGQGISALGNNAFTGVSLRGGGGGGAGAAATNANGGGGLASSFIGSSVTRAGGGGAGGNTGPGTGGTGGGAAGVTGGTPNNGTVNTGGGGGGQGGAASAASGNGGSGRVIVRVKV